LDLGDNASNFYFAAEQTKSFYKNGWNKISFRPSAFLAQDPTGWHSITWIRVCLAAKKDSTVNAWFDDWQIIENGMTPLPTTTPSAKQINSTNNKQPTNKGGAMTNNLFWILGILLIIIIAVWVIIWLLKIRKKQQTDEEESRFNFWKKKLNWPAIWIPIGLAIIIAVGLGFYLCPSTASSPSETKTTSTPGAVTQEKSDKWEYQVVTFTIPKQTNEAIGAELNILGEKDWEVVSQSTISTGKTGEYYLYLTLKKSL
jgi:flagellar basal body-associated protein FliL